MDDGSKSHPFGHAVVTGVERYPLKVTRRMGKTKIAKRSKVKPFIKVVNYNHLMPTRYTLEIESLKGVLTGDTFAEPSAREDAKKSIKKSFEEKYTSGKNKWFFTRTLSHSLGGNGVGGANEICSSPFLDAFLRPFFFSLGFIWSECTVVSKVKWEPS
jgi:large subunit ribosomal protein L27e